MAIAIVVMALCFFWRETDFGTALVRTGWAFTMGYGAVFIFVRVILRTTLFEMVEHEREKKSKKRSGALATATPESLGGAEVTLDDLGLQPLTPRSET